MNPIFLRFAITLSVFFLFTFSACKKDDSIGDDFNLGKNEMSMKVDGVPWKATMTMLLTVTPEETEEDYYVVGIVGSEVNLKDGDDVENVKGMTLYFAVPKAKFKSPNGVYNFTGMEDVSPEFPAFALFNGWDNETHTFFATIGSGVSTEGSLKIDKFKTGKQTFMGVDVSEYEGYTHLSGSFAMTMTEYGHEEGKTPRVITISDGKFDVSSGLGLGGLFGQYSEITEKLLLK